MYHLSPGCSGLEDNTLQTARAGDLACIEGSGPPGTPFDGLESKGSGTPCEPPANLVPTIPLMSEVCSGLLATYNARLEVGPYNTLMLGGVFTPFFVQCAQCVCSGCYDTYTARTIRVRAWRGERCAMHPACSMEDIRVHEA